MRCEVCQSEAVLWAHDAGAAAHSWPDGGEAGCECAPEPVCASCEAARLILEGFLLLPRDVRLRAVAPAGQMRH